MSDGLLHPNLRYVSIRSVDTTQRRSAQKFIGRQPTCYIAYIVFHCLQIELQKHDLLSHLKGMCLSKLCQIRASQHNHATEKHKRY